MKDKIYKILATKLDAYHRCRESDNQVWENNHFDEIKEIEQKLPFDAVVIVQESDDNQLIILFSEYDDCVHRIADYTLIVTPSLYSDFNLNFRLDRKYQDVSSDYIENSKEYFAQVFNPTLKEVIDEKDLTCVQRLMQSL